MNVGLFFGSLSVFYSRFFIRRFSSQKELRSSRATRDSLFKKRYELRRSILLIEKSCVTKTKPRRGELLIKQTIKFKKQIHLHE